MKKNTVYVLLRTDGHASPTIDGVFSSEKKAETYRNELLEQFGESLKEYEKGNTEYGWEIEQKEIQ